MHDIVVMVGIPLAGKSTLTNYLRNLDRYVAVCPDTVRYALHGNQFIPSAEPHVWATVDTMARTLLMQGDKIIIDATNTHINARNRWTRIAKEMNKTIAAYVLMTPFEVSIERNKEINRVDSLVIERMINQFEYPTKKEGFDDICHVYTSIQGEYIFKIIDKK